MLRFTLLFLVFCALGLCALAFEASLRTKNSIDVLGAAAAINEPALRARLLGSEVAQMETSWARPARWHAGAADALSALYAAQAEAQGGDRALYARSASAASQAVALAPVQPQAWARLAAFAQMGLPGIPCSVAQCLEMSFASARMTDEPTACARLRIAHGAGLLNNENDPRISWYLRSGFGGDEIARCLSFFGSDVRFRLLMRAQTGRS